MFRKFGFIAILVGVILATTGCQMTKDECKSKYGLVDPGPGPTDGPIIILSRGASTWEWRVDGVLQGGGGPANGVLRDDFIGDKVLKLEAEYVDSSNNTGTVQVTSLGLAKTGVNVTLNRTSMGLWWTLQTLPLYPSGTWGGTTVPDEFLDLQPATFNPPLPAGVTVRSVTMQVRKPQ